MTVIGHAKPGAPGPTPPDDVVFTPSADDVASSQMTAFVQHCESQTGRRFPDSESFYRFSVEEIATFWRLFLTWSGIEHDGSDELVYTSAEVEQATFFPDLRLNVVENLLREVPGREDAPALVSRRPGDGAVRLTRRELRNQVVEVIRYLEDLGVRPADRVVAVSSNTEKLIVAALAVMGLGATLSTAAPDMGAAAVVSRFGQLSPRWMLYGVNDSHVLAPGQRETRLLDLVAGLPTVETVVVLDAFRPATAGPVATVFLEERPASQFTDAVTWPRFGFNHPLCVLFSSGTTGVPKCIVHGAGGVLVEHAKEHLLHGDLRPDDVMLYHTSPAWMMWNWQLSALFAGATVVLYDGPVSSPDVLWSVVESEQVSAFGTSPTYLKLCQDRDFVPRERHDLSRLRRVMSTGSVLHDHQFDWARDHVGDVPVQSISGGTDIVGCFLLGNPNLPVRRGELQCRSLGLDVRVVPVEGGAPGEGELTCWNPFPSRPLGLYGDEDGSAFHRAYFADNPGVWTHGDRIAMTERGSARVLGRSDGVMNIGGVRVGPAEIYTLLSDVSELSRMMAVEQRTSADADSSRIVLLVVMRDGAVLDVALRARIRRTVARGASSAHVPALIVAVPDLPRTYSGKDSERAARDAVNGVPVENAQALPNADCLPVITEGVREAESERASEHERHLGEMGETLTSTEEDDLSVLQAVFADVLDLPSVGPDDNFFELGGTSLAVAQLCSSIQQTLGHEVPLSSVFLAPTPRGIDAFVTGEQGSLPPTLVRLRRGDPSLRPVFVLFDVTGDVVSYHHLVEHLEGSRPVYGVRARSMDGRGSIDDSVADMAESAIDDIRRVQAGGPYTLVGYSFGGMVAFEVARRLRASGDEIELLVMLDAYLSIDRLTPWERRRFLLAGRPLQIAKRLTRADLPDLRVVARRYLHRVLQPSSVVAQGRPRTPAQRAFLAHARRQILAFEPAPYDGDVVFVRCDIPLTYCPDPVPAWRRAIGDRLRVVRFEGSHFSLRRADRAEEVAALLASFLRSSPSGL